MIDIAFSKLALIGVAALVFIGPEKLPRVARMAGTLLGRAQRYIADVKSEVSREMDLDEFRKMQREVQEAADSVTQSVSNDVAEVHKDVSSSWHGGDYDSGSHSVNPLEAPPEPDQIAVKARTFRKKKLAHSSAVPAWYKQQNGRKSRVLSGAARVAKYRPAGAPQAASFH